MRQAVSTTTILKIVLVFTFIFAGFLSVAIVYNKAYKMKNEALTIIEKYEGTKKGINVINSYLRNNGYNIKGKCASDEYGINSLDEVDYEAADNNTKYYYCIKSRCNDGSSCEVTNNNKIYYNVKIFFRFNLPVFGDLFTFSVEGETKPIVLYDKETQKIKT